MGRNKREKLIKPKSKVKVSGVSRGVTISCKSLTQEEVELKSKLDKEEFTYSRPKTRCDCVNGIRPCPFVGCKYHLYLTVNEKNGSIKLNYPDLDFHEIPETCYLDIIDRKKGEITLEEVGGYTNLTRERVRQIEETAIKKLKDAGFFDDETLRILKEYFNFKD